jgi:hypothetical protein
MKLKEKNCLWHEQSTADIKNLLITRKLTFNENLWTHASNAANYTILYKQNDQTAFLHGKFWESQDMHLTFVDWKTQKGQFKKSCTKNLS